MPLDVQDLYCPVRDDAADPTTRCEIVKDQILGVVFGRRAMRLAHRSRPPSPYRARGLDRLRPLDLKRPEAHSLYVVYRSLVEATARGRTGENFATASRKDWQHEGIPKIHSGSNNSV